MANAVVLLGPPRFQAGSARMGYTVTLSNNIQFASNFLLNLAIPTAQVLANLKNQVITQAAGKGVVVAAGDIFIVGGFFNEQGGRAVFGYGGLVGAALLSMVRWGGTLSAGLAIDALGARILVPSAALLRGIRVRRATAPGAGIGNAYTVRVNGIDTAAT